jgi:PAS domain S-box-containing protein
LLGYDNNEIEASLDNFSALLHPDDAAETFEAVDSHFEKDEPFRMNYRLRTKTGAYRWFKGAGQVAKNLEGTPCRMVGTIQDIHEQILAEQNLLRINEELLQISYRTSHDLKAPLTTTKRLAQFIVQDIEGGDIEEAKTNVVKIGKQMEKLEELVSGILSLAKVDSVAETKANVDFDALASEIDARLEYERASANCQVSWDINVSKAISGEKTRYVQIIENLVSNGIKYRNPASASTFVQTSIADDEQSLLIEVQDNGMGIPARYQPEVYDMFKRFHPDVREGSGLGLSIVKKHIDFLNGSISVSSDTNGTKFTIVIPKGSEEYPCPR